MIYPLDYGYLAGTTAADGGGIDVWAGSLENRRPNGLVLTVDLKKRDAEIKILLGCTAAEMERVLNILNGEFMRAVLVRRGAGELDWIFERRSVRRFRPDPVPPEVVERILNAATRAPSAHNRQPWRFAVVASAEAKGRLAEGMGREFRRDLLADGLDPAEVEAQVERSRQRITQAQVDILVCLDQAEMDTYPDERRRQAEYLMGVQSAAMAGENLLLAAHAEGLGGVWMCAPLFSQESARRSLNLPAGWEPQGLILLGYPAKIPEPRGRRPLDEVARFY
jgi:F420 biosynthesis protein FbiB-like protein